MTLWTLLASQRSESSLPRLGIVRVFRYLRTMRHPTPNRSPMTPDCIRWSEDRGTAAALLPSHRAH